MFHFRQVENADVFNSFKTQLFNIGNQSPGTRQGFEIKEFSTRSKPQNIQKVEIGLEFTNDDHEEKIDKKESFLEAVQE